MHRRSTRIGLVFTHSWAYCREVLRGIKEFAELRPNWVLMPVAPDPQAIQALSQIKPHGLIVHVFSEATATAVKRLRKPFVNVSGMMNVPITPRVGNDDVACGRLAGEHLLDRGLRHFGFVGSKEHFYSRSREEGFRRAISAPGFQMESYYEPPRQPVDMIGRMWLQHRSVGRWLAALPRPVGLFACDDQWALQLTEVCRQFELRVPEDVSIVGVENDELLCNLARPTISTVQPNSRQVGIEAAKLLDRLLHGRKPPAHPILLPPTGLVPRRSTDTLAIADEDVVAAVRLIRDNAHWPIHIRDILEQVPVSRRSLERRFRLALGRSMLDEIRRVHIDRACRLLADTDFPIPLVATSAGFTDSKQLWLIFRQLLGQTPTEYRRSVKHPGDAALLLPQK